MWTCGRKVCDVQVGYSFILGFHALQPAPPCHGPEETDLVTLGRFSLELLYVLPSAIAKKLPDDTAEVMQMLTSQGLQQYPQ